MHTPDTWSEIAESPFVSLGTFRRTGVVVATPVRIAPDGAELVVTSERATGKIKRLRNNPRVTLQRCSRMGRIEPDAVTVIGTARLIGSDADEAANRALAGKYGFQFRAFLGVERFVRRLQRKPGERVIIRILPAATA
jgi:PPOX class probable F420-dependent enzyme